MQCIFTMIFEYNGVVLERYGYVIIISCEKQKQSQQQQQHVYGLIHSYTEFFADFFLFLKLNKRSEYRVGI